MTNNDLSPSLPDTPVERRWALQAHPDLPEYIQGYKAGMEDIAVILDRMVARDSLKAKIALAALVALNTKLKELGLDDRFYV